jgi:restriction system protein
MIENDLYLEKLAKELLESIETVEFVQWERHIYIRSRDDLRNPRLKHMTKEMVAGFYKVPLKTIEQRSVPSRNGKYLEYSGRQILDGNDCRDFYSTFYRPIKEINSASYLEGICRIIIFSFQSVVHFAYLTDLGEIGKEVNQLLGLDKYKELRDAFVNYKKDYRKKQNEDKDADMKNVIDMEWSEFESLIARLFENMGYRVSKTAYSGDRGADLIAKKGSDTIAIEVKHYNKNIEKKVVKNVFCAKYVYKTNRAMVVNICDFTKPAYEWARVLDVELVNYDELKIMMKKYINYKVKDLFEIKSL